VTSTDTGTGFEDAAAFITAIETALGVDDSFPVNIVEDEFGIGIDLEHVTKSHVAALFDVITSTPGIDVTVTSPSRRIRLTAGSLSVDEAADQFAVESGGVTFDVEENDG
jgi:hypothetical protein